MKYTEEAASERLSYYLRYIGVLYQDSKDDATNHSGAAV